MKDYLEIGQIVNTHGLKGYIKVDVKRKTTIKGNGY